MPSNRRSSRSRRPPEVYHPTTRVSGFGSQPRSQAGAGAGAGAGSGSSAKPRRRGRRALAALDDDVAMDSDEGGAEPVVTSSDDDSGDDDDFSPDASSAKRRTSTARSASKQKPRGSAKKTSTARRAAAAVGEDQELWGAVNQKSVALQAVVADVLERLEDDFAPAASELLSFLCSCFGCNIRITPDELVDGSDEGLGEEELQGQFSLEADELVKNITDRAVEHGADGFPLVKAKGQKASDHRRTVKNVCEFWRRLFLQARHSMLFTHEWPVFIADVLVALCGSVTFPLRHSAVMLGIEVGQAYVEVAAAKQKEAGVAERQLRSAKEAKKRNAKKERQLEAQLEEIKQQVGQLDTCLLDLFNSIMVNRYKDVHKEIRADVIAAIGKWVLGYPALFLKETYIKYIGWLLADREAVVRRRALAALTPLYEVESFIASLSNFTKRFKPRMVDMVFDSDEAAAVAATELLTLCNKHDLLTDIDVNNMQEVFFEPSLARREALAGFLMNYLACFTGEDAEGSEEKRAHTQLRSLAEVARILLNTSHGRTDYMTDLLTAFWSGAPVVYNWQAYSSLLLLDEDEEMPLEEEGQELLVRLMVEAAGYVQSKLRATDKAKLKPTARAAMERIADDMTLHLVNVLPRLFTKFQTSDTAILCLARMVPMLRLANVAKSRSSGAVKALLGSISKLYRASTQEEVCEALAFGTRLLVRSDHASQSAADQMARQLVGELVFATKAAIITARDTMAAGDEDESSPEDKEFAMCTALMRLGVFLSAVPTSVPMHKDLEPGKTICIDALELVAERTDVKNLFMAHASPAPPKAVELGFKVLLAICAGHMQTLVDQCDSWKELTEDDKAEFATALRKLTGLRKKLTGLLEDLLCTPEASLEELGAEEQSVALQYLDACKVYAHRAASDALRLFPCAKLDGTVLARLAWRLPKAVESMMVELVHMTPDYDSVDVLDAGTVEELLSSELATAEAAALGEAMVSEEVQQIEHESGVLTARYKRLMSPVARMLFFGSPRLVGSVLVHMTEGGDMEAAIKKLMKFTKAHRDPKHTYACILEALKQVFDSHLQSLEEAQAVTAEGDDERATELTQLADDALEAAMALGKRLSEALGVGKLTKEQELPYMHFMQRSLQYAFMDAPSRLVFTVVLRPFLRRLRPNHKTVLQGVVEKFVELLEPEAADLYDAFQLKQENKAADGEEDDEDDEDSDKELPWFALQAFRQSLGGDAGRTTGGRTRRTSPTKRSRKSRSRKSSMGTVATPRKKLDMGDDDDGSQQATPTPKRKRASTGSQSAPRNAAQSHASPASDAEFSDDDVQPSSAKKPRRKSTSSQRSKQARTPAADKDGWVTTSKSPKQPKNSQRRRSRRR